MTILYYISHNDLELFKKKKKKTGFNYLGLELMTWNPNC